MLLAGKVLLVAVLALTAVTAITSGQLGWRNYWGGLVYPPLALLAAALCALAIIKRRDISERHPRRRRK